MSDGPIYDRSNMPTAPGAPTANRGPRGDGGPVGLRHTDKIEGDRVGYVSLELQGKETLEWPLMHADSSAQKVTKLQVREVADTILRSVETGLATGDAPAVLGHFSGCLRGSKLLTPAGEARMQELVRGLSNSTNRESYVENEIRPFLDALRPQRR